MANISVSTQEDFDAALVTMMDRFINVIDYPMSVSGGRRSDDTNGTLMFTYWNGREQVIESIQINFSTEGWLFPLMDTLNQQLLDAQKVVDGQWITDHTHVIKIAWGTWAETDDPVWNEYKVKMDDTDAMLAAIKFGGRLSKVE